MINVSTNSIYEKIEQNGLEEADRIKEAGIQKALRYKEDRITEEKNNLDLSLRLLKEKQDVELKRELSMFDQSMKRKTLSFKKELLDQVIIKTHQKLKNLKDEELRNFVIKMIHSNQVIGNEMMKVSQAEVEKYIRLFSSKQMNNGYYLLDKLNKELKHEKYQLKLSLESANIDGGFILIGENFDIDLSYLSILREIKEQNESKIASLLFGE